jgi:hypothetical protein
MTLRSDPLFEMLDTATADRMLDGAVLPGDAPPGYERVALLLSVLSEPRPTAAIVAAAPRTAQPPRISRGRRRPLLVATAVAAAILSSTAGAAFANILPDAIDRPLSHLMQRISHPTSSPERLAGMRTTPPSGGLATERSRQTAPEPPNDRSHTGSTTAATQGAPTAPDSTGDATSRAPVATPPSSSPQPPPPGDRTAPDVPAPLGPPEVVPSSLEAAVRPAPRTPPSPAPEAAFELTR